MHHHHVSAIFGDLGPFAGHPHRPGLTHATHAATDATAHLRARRHGAVGLDQTKGGFGEAALEVGTGGGG